MAYSLLAPAPPQPPSTEAVPGQQPVEAEVMPVEVMPVKNQQVTEIRGAGFEGVRRCLVHREEKL